MGISKRVKLKTLLKVAAAIGFLVMMTLGLDKVNADVTWTNINISSSFFHSPYTEALTYSSDFNDIVTPISTLEWRTDYGKGVRFYNNSLSRVFYMPFAMSKGFATTSSRYWTSDYLFNEASLKFNNSNYCENSTTDLKSINFQFPLTFDTNMQNDMAFFNQSSIADMFKVRMVAQSTTNNETILFPTYCTFESLEPNQSEEYKYKYLVTCNNVFQGNSNYSVSDFTIQIINAIPFNDRYSDSTENKGIVPYISIGNSDYTMYNLVNYQLRYSCSDDPPVLDNGSGGEDDPFGLNDIYDKIRDNYSDVIPGIDLFDIELPDSVQELISLPIYVVNNIVENSGTCSPYQIDFSSMVNHFGSPGGTYVLTIPCMRSYLSNLLSIGTHTSNSGFIPSSNNGFNLYNLIDTLMAAVVFYNIGLAIIQLIDAITSGADLYSYYYSRQSKKDGLHINHETGEVK